MSRYIDEDKFIGNLKTDHWGITNMVEVGIALDKSVADVVEVVRCSECMWFTDADEIFGTCGLHKYDCYSDHYCSYGKRRAE